MQISRREFVRLMASVSAALATPWAHAQPIRIRREINTLGAPQVAALEAGVAAMRALPATDFRSWLYQRGVHGALAADAVGVPDAPTYWNQCVHSSEHFLDWHRWYILYTEEIMRQMSGDASFTLPYWDYIKDGFLPAPFRNPASTLYNGTRAGGLNAGTSQLSGLNANALDRDVFSGPGNFADAVRNMPHNAVHGQVGGNMGGVQNAALDPIFYLHHCNIDRFWQVWLDDDPAHVNPGGAWGAQTYAFRTVSGVQSRPSSQASPTTALGYKYDGPLVFNVHDLLRLDIYRLLKLIRRPPPRIPPHRVPPPPPPPWRVLAVFEGLVLDGSTTVAVMPLAATERSAVLEAARATKGQVVVSLNDISMTDEGRKGGFFFEVWVVPSRRELRAREVPGARLVGSLSSFDVPDTKGAGAAGHADHMPGARVELALRRTAGEDLSKVLTNETALVFVRKGLVDKAGVVERFDASQKLFEIGEVRIEVEAPRR